MRGRRKKKSTWNNQDGKEGRKEGRKGKKKQLQMFLARVTRDEGLPPPPQPQRCVRACRFLSSRPEASGKDASPDGRTQCVRVSSCVDT